MLYHLYLHIFFSDHPVSVFINLPTSKRMDCSSYSLQRLDDLGGGFPLGNFSWRNVRANKYSNITKTRKQKPPNQTINNKNKFYWFFFTLKTWLIGTGVFSLAIGFSLRAPEPSVQKLLLEESELVFNIGFCLVHRGFAMKSPVKPCKLRSIAAQSYSVMLDRFPQTYRVVFV